MGKYALLVFFFVVALSATSYAMDGNEMLQKCRPLFDDRDNELTRKQEYDSAYCGGYIAGVLDVAAIWKRVEGDSSKAEHHCKPFSVPLGQVLKIIKKWLDQNPDKLHYGAATIIHLSVREAFPCKTG